MPGPIDPINVISKVRSGVLLSLRCEKLRCRHQQHCLSTSDDAYIMMSGIVEYLIQSY